MTIANASRTHLRPPTKAQLAETLARVERSERALIEHFVCERHERGAFQLDVPIDGGGVRVNVYGMTRAAGGVAVVTMLSEVGLANAWRDFPRFLDDLLIEYKASHQPEFRAAADQLDLARWEALTNAGALNRP